LTGAFALLSIGFLISILAFLGEITFSHIESKFYGGNKTLNRNNSTPTKI
jgi:hypothetical protein